MFCYGNPGCGRNKGNGGGNIEGGSSIAPGAAGINHTVVRNDAGIAFGEGIRGAKGL